MFICLQSIHLLTLFFAFYIISSIYCNNKTVEILIANNFKRWFPYYTNGVYNCNNKIICIFTSNFTKRINFALYNAWTKYIEYDFNIKQKRLLWSMEKISWKIDMVNISLGVHSSYYGGIDYRLFYSPYHFSNTYLGTIKISLKQFIKNAHNNIGSLKSFMERKSIIYIQRKSYSKRNKLVKYMMKYINIDSYGKDLNNKVWPKGKSKIDLIKNYKFCLAIENSIQTSNDNKLYSDNIDLDYSTEKLYDCLEGGSIPIYYGPNNSYTFLPNNNSAIVMGTFKNINEVIVYVKKIEHSEEDILKYISWPQIYSKSWYYRFSREFRFSRCKFCKWAYKYKK